MLVFVSETKTLKIETEFKMKPFTFNKNTFNMLSENPHPKPNKVLCTNLPNFNIKITKSRDIKNLMTKAF